MTNATAIIAPITPLDQLYTVERHIENAEQHLMLAIEQLLHANDAHDKATTMQANATCPAFYARVQERLTKTIEMMRFCTKLGV